MQLCFGCLHTFPDSNLTTLPFDDETNARFDSIRSSVAKLQPTTAATRQSVADIEEDIRGLGRALIVELQRKERRIEQLQAQLSFMMEQEEALRAQLATPVAPPKPRQTRSNNSQSPYASGLLQRFMASSQKMTTPRTPLPTSPRSEVRENRFGEKVTGGAHSALIAASSDTKATKSHTADVLGSTLYNILESVVVKTHAKVGAVWMVASEKEELAAPIVVGTHHSRRVGAPQRTSATSSLPGLCSVTGVAINVRATPKLRGAASKHEPLSQMLQAHGRSQLLIPIFSRYGAVSRDAVGVIQLVAAPSGAAFTTEDEVTTTAVAAVFSHIISTYHTSMNDVMQRQFDPSHFVRNACYFADMDQNASGKGGTIMDSFSQPRNVIFRADLDQDNADGAAGNKGNSKGPGVDASGRFSKQDVLQCAVVGEVFDELRDLRRYTKTLETCYKDAVNTQADMERKNLDVTKRLDATKQQLNDSRRALETQQLRHLTAESMRRAAPGTNDPVGITTSASVSGLLTDLSAGDVDDIESDAQIRLKALRPQPPSKSLSSTTFLTEASRADAPRGSVVSKKGK